MIISCNQSIRHKETVIFLKSSLALIQDRKKKATQDKGLNRRSPKANPRNPQKEKAAAPAWTSKLHQPPNPKNLKKGGEWKGKSLDVETECDNSSDVILPKLSSRNPFRNNLGHKPNITISLSPH
ncbi:hypothetical protein KC19_5G178200 [Ceratodon purpureus]|uniref:Uncharacterized protein n=1 Tax=Ceratodon purpureus TaxID=3225 RepID=A0A8T0I3S7_CERPU|nr:hypothetical protein KC19_5G178200 [Ceratodon purpureus]